LDAKNKPESSNYYLSALCISVVIKESAGCYAIFGRRKVLKLAKQRRVSTIQQGAWSVVAGQHAAFTDKPTPLNNHLQPSNSQNKKLSDSSTAVNKSGH